MKKIYTLFAILIFSFQFLSAQNCNNWLNTPSIGTAVKIGDLDVTGNQITVEAIINRTQPYLPGTGNNTEGDIVSKHIDPNTINYLLRPNHAYITTSNGFFGTPDICDIQLNKIYHVAMVYDGSTLKFYRDGFLMSQVNATGNLIQTNINTMIGLYEAAAFSTQFLGFTNEVRIWNVARTQSQIQTYMNNSLPNPNTQTGLLAYYTFDNLLNKQGNPTFNGVLVGSAAINATNTNCTYIADSCSRSIQCNNWLSTPLVGSAVNIGDLDVPGNQVTVEAIINRNQVYLPGTGNNNEGDIVSKHIDTNSVNYLLRPNHAYINTTNGFFGTPDICDILLNNTYHVAMVYDGNTLKFYRDGYLMSQINATGNLIQNNITTRIGLYEAEAFSTQFLGFINEVRIWNVARTQSQILAYMSNSLQSPNTQTGLLAYYTFDNLLNKQGNATYNGILTGGSSINGTNPNCAFIRDTCLYALGGLSTFTASVISNKKVQLNWHTEEDNGIRNYIIQRSTSPGTVYSSIGNVIVNNNSFNNDYTFTDKSIKPNLVYYYRLQIIERSGNTKYSEIKSAKITSSESNVSIYPNPTKGVLNLTINNFKGIATLSLLNSIGQVILTKQINSIDNIQTTIDIRSHKKGNYYLIIQNDQDKIVRKIVKL